MRAKRDHKNFGVWAGQSYWCSYRSFLLLTQLWCKVLVMLTFRPRCKHPKRFDVFVRLVAWVGIRDCPFFMDTVFVRFSLRSIFPHSASNFVSIRSAGWCLLLLERRCGWSEDSVAVTYQPALTHYPILAFAWRFRAFLSYTDGAWGEGVT